MTRSFTLATLAAIGLTCGASSHAAAAQHGLGGTWKVAIILVDCMSGAPLAPAFTSLLAFAGNGVESETTNNPAFQPGQRSPGFGVWTHTGGANYQVDVTALILFVGTGAHPIGAGSQQIHQNITLSGDSFSSVATIQFYDPNGAPTGNGCATATAARLGA